MPQPPRAILPLQQAAGQAPGSRSAVSGTRAAPVCAQITEVTRRRLVEGLEVRGIVWSGALEDTEFLSRLYDLDALPSTDPRFRSASEDIFQHRVNSPTDWDDDWVFSDPRFGLADSDDAIVRVPGGDAAPSGADRHRRGRAGALLP
jgi:AbiJ N-terminal domain 3